jgi:hypothetical protein
MYEHPVLQWMLGIFVVNTVYYIPHGNVNVMSKNVYFHITVMLTLEKLGRLG